MPDPLHQELTSYQMLRQQIEAQFPDADEETLLDTLEGLTSLNEMLAAVVRSRLDDMALINALKSRVARMQERLGRFEHRAEKKKELVTAVMDRAGIKKLEQPDFTVSLRQKNQTLVITDQTQIPKIYWKPQEPKLDRQGLISSLKAGTSVPGTALDNGGVTISVRTR